MDEPAQGRPINRSESPAGANARGGADRDSLWV